MDSKKYQVFISSTFLDLMEERKIIHDALTLAGYLPVEMENFGSVGMSQTEYINKLLDQTDYYVLIIAGKYGSLNDDGISYTEAEYDYAVSKNIPILPFVVKNIDKLPRDKTETDKSREKKLKAFRDKVTSEKLCTFYEDAEQLGTAVLASMDKAIKLFSRPGWIRANERNNTDSKEISISTESDLNRLMKVFGKIAVTDDVLKLLRSGLNEKEPDGSLYWKRGEKRFRLLLDEMRNAYEDVRLTVISDELLEQIEQLKEMVEDAYFSARNYRDLYLIYLCKGNPKILDEDSFENYERLMKEIPEKYNDIVLLIRKLRNGNGGF